MYKTAIERHNANPESLGTWHGIRVTLVSVDIVSGGYSNNIVRVVRLSRPGFAAEFTIKSGYGWRATKTAIIAHCAAYAQYAFIDGDPDHGMQPYCRAVATHVGQDPWCESLEFDSESPDTLVAYAGWLRDAFLVAEVLGDKLYLAYDLEG